MTEDYCKLASGIILSTIWREDDRTRILWITMLALKGRDHRVMASVPGLAAVANIPIPDCRAGLQKLMASDPDSRTKDHDGRRIAEIDGGWVILNGEKYRNFLSKAERNEYQRQLMATRRAEAKALAGVRKCDKTLAKLGQAEAEAQAEADTEAERSPPPHFPEIEVPSWNEFWQFCQTVGFTAEWYARDKFLLAASNNFQKQSNWREYAKRAKGWWEQDGRPENPTKTAHRRPKVPNL